MHLIAITQSRSSKGLLVENSLSEPKKQKCRLTSKKIYKKVCEFLNLYNIYKKEEINKEITSFLFEKICILCFFGKLAFCLN